MIDDESEQVKMRRTDEHVLVPTHGGEVLYSGLDTSLCLLFPYDRNKFILEGTIVRNLLDHENMKRSCLGCLV